MQQIWLKYRNSILFPAIIIAVAIIYFTLSSDESSSTNDSIQLLTTVEHPPLEQEQEIATQNEPNIIEQTETIIVDVKGAVKFPGIFELTTNNRIMDAIEAAGGYTDKANPVTINHAQKLVDEMVIYVPYEGENLEEIPVQTVVASAVNASSSSDSKDSKVNINKATETELTSLPGIGPSKAAAIVAYREENGGFQKVEDLTKVSGIGDKTFERLKELITVN